MHPILQMHLEIIHAHLRAGRVQFPGTVGALDAGIIHELDVVRRRRVGPDRDREVRDVIDGRVAHRAFEGVLRVAFLEPLEGVQEPGWWFRLCFRGDGFLAMCGRWK